MVNRERGESTGEWRRRVKGSNIKAEFNTKTVSKRMGAEGAICIFFALVFSDAEFLGS